MDITIFLLLQLVRAYDQRSEDPGLNPDLSILTVPP